jgi:RNA polymerase sigma factor (sigma-70 family)
MEGNLVNGKSKVARFESCALPHMDASYNLARWLTRNDHDAADITQEAYLRAFRFFDGFHGTDARAWLLAIVRNTFYTWLTQNRSQDLLTPFDEEIHGHTAEHDAVSEPVITNPETLMLQQADQQLLRQALEALPVEFREVVVLRELDDMSYKQIAAITNLPVGTVMSRLARGRKRLLESLSGGTKTGVSP